MWHEIIENSFLNKELKEAYHKMIDKKFIQMESR